MENRGISWKYLRNTAAIFTARCSPWNFPRKTSKIIVVIAVVAVVVVVVAEVV